MADNVDTRRGTRTFYPSKRQSPVTSNFTDDAHAAMDFYKNQIGASRGDLLEHAVRKMCGLPLNLDFEAQLMALEYEPVALGG